MNLSSNFQRHGIILAAEMPTKVPCHNPMHPKTIMVNVGGACQHPQCGFPARQVITETPCPRCGNMMSIKEILQLQQDFDGHTPLCGNCHEIQIWPDLHEDYEIQHFVAGAAVTFEDPRMAENITAVFSLLVCLEFLSEAENRIDAITIAGHLRAGPTGAVQQYIFNQYMERALAHAHELLTGTSANESPPQQGNRILLVQDSTLAAGPRGVVGSVAGRDIITGDGNTVDNVTQSPFLQRGQTVNNQNNYAPPGVTQPLFDQTNQTILGTQSNYVGDFVQNDSQETLAHNIRTWFDGGNVEYAITEVDNFISQDPWPQISPNLGTSILYVLTHVIRSNAKAGRERLNTTYKDELVDRSFTITIARYKTADQLIAVCQGINYNDFMVAMVEVMKSVGLWISKSMTRLKHELLTTEQRQTQLDNPYKIRGSLDFMYQQYYWLNQNVIGFKEHLSDEGIDALFWYTKRFQPIETGVVDPPPAPDAADVANRLRTLLNLLRFDEAESEVDLLFTKRRMEDFPPDVAAAMLEVITEVIVRNTHFASNIHQQGVPVNNQEAEVLYRFGVVIARLRIGHALSEAYAAYPCAQNFITGIDQSLTDLAYWFYRRIDRLRTQYVQVRYPLNKNQQERKQLRSQLNELYQNYIWLRDTFVGFNVDDPHGFDWYEEEFGIASADGTTVQKNRNVTAGPGGLAIGGDFKGNITINN